VTDCRCVIYKALSFLLALPGSTIGFEDFLDAITAKLVAWMVGWHKFAQKTHNSKTHQTASHWQAPLRATKSRGTASTKSLACLMTTKQGLSGKMGHISTDNLLLSDTGYPKIPHFS
jgi:hypothetical protein